MEEREKRNGLVLKIAASTRRKGKRE